MKTRMNISLALHATRLPANGLCACILLVLGACSLSWSSSSAGIQSEAEQVIHGSVKFSDGTAVSAAKVTATAKCDGISFTKDTTTSEDGSFSFPLFHLKMLDPNQSEADCKQYQFRASKKADFWLSSDDNIFTGGTPTIPSVDLPLRLPSQPVQIVLSTRGGEIAFLVWDVATNRFVHAMLWLSRKSVEGQKFGSVEWETSDGGKADVQLLPRGEYTVQVQSFPCGADEFWAAYGPVTSFSVQAGVRVEKDITIDVRSIRPLRRYRGHPRGNCKP
jgi:hypothetical protein